MSNVKFNTDTKHEVYKICFIGSCAVGKTSIINRIINNSFTGFYDPTLEQVLYHTEFKLKKNYISDNIEDSSLIYERVNLVLEDLFGLNNSIIQTNSVNIKSTRIKEKRINMINCLKDVIYSCNSIVKSYEDYDNIHSKDILSNTSRILSYQLSIPRLGLIFVIDITDENTFKEALTIINQIIYIEKNSGCKTEKCILLNKHDKMSDNKKIINLKDKLSEVIEHCLVYEVSAFSNYNINESLSKFILKMQNKFFKFNDIKKNINYQSINEEVEEDRKENTIEQSNNLGNKIFCGANLFSCGRGNN